MTTTTASRGELPIIQATMDLIQWFVPLLNRLPRDHRFALGGRRYATVKLQRLEPLNARRDLLRLQIRLPHSFQLIDDRRGWISQQRRQGQAVSSACGSLCDG